MAFLSWKLGYLNVLLESISVLLLLGYNLNLCLRFRRNPMGTAMGVNHHGRRAWVRAIMEDNEKKNILAVQTLRNNIMGSTLLATTCILLSSAVGAFLASTYDVKRHIHSVVLGHQSSTGLYITFLSLMVTFLFSFLCFVQSIRYTNDMNFIINIPIQGQFTPHYVADVLERASNAYSIGTRILNMSIPLLFWIFGPITFLVSTLFLIPVWCWLDTAQGYQIVNESHLNEVDNKPLSLEV